MRPANMPSSLLGTKLAVVLILMARLVAADLSSQGASKSDSASTDKDGRPSRFALIDWRTYTRTFNKQYSSLTQQLVRNKLFLLNTMKVFLTAAKYKLGNGTYWTVINRFSDMTSQEEHDKLSGDLGDQADDGADNLEIMDDAQIERILRADLEDFATESQLGQARLTRPKPIIKQRRRRSPREQAETPKPGGLAAADLVRMPSEHQRDQAFNVKWVVPPDNPHYVPVEWASEEQPTLHERAEGVSWNQMGRIDQEARGWLAYRAPSLSSLGSATKNTYNWLAGGSSASNDATLRTGAAAQKVDDDKEPELPTVNEVIKDWRESGCISAPYDQGDCNSCYAISSMSFIEWAFCMNQDRVLTPLSAQYFVSCGPQYMEESDPKLKIEFYGCNKGRTRQAMHFVKDYGVELAAHMPYLAEDTACPVRPHAPLKHKGYIRPNVKQHIRMSASTTQLELALKTGPVMVNFREPVDFLAYGGGMVGDCYQRGGHAMLVVGHGIENDQPYLLIKNSFGTDWGSNGYLKFDRKYTQACVKDFILPRVSFPSKKAQARRMKAYGAAKAGPAFDVNNIEVHLDNFAVD